MKAYLIIDVNIVDPEGFMEYVRRIPELLEKHSGKYLVQGVKPIVVEGDANKPQRSVVIEFPGKEFAESFLAERRSSDLYKIWEHTTNSRILLVEGCT